MEAGTNEKQSRSSDLPPDAPAGLKKAADDETVGPAEEVSAITYLLGGSTPLEYTVKLDWDTAEGMKIIPWRIRALDGRTIERIENEARKGEGPFAEMDDLRASAGIVAEATISPDLADAKLRTPPATERVPRPAPDADPVDSLMRVFRFQSGLMVGLAAEVRRISGWAPDRVGTAQRSMVRAAGN